MSRQDTGWSRRWALQRADGSFVEEVLLGEVRTPVKTWRTLADLATWTETQLSPDHTVIWPSETIIPGDWRP